MGFSYFAEAEASWKARGDLNLSLPAPGPGRRTYISMRHNHDDDADLYYDSYHLIAKKRPMIVLVVFMSFLMGALLRTIIKEVKIPILVIVCLVGTGIGTIPHFSAQIPIVKSIADIDPVLFLHLFTPVIIFTAAFEMDFYIFRKSFWQVLILAVPGFLMNCAFLGWLTYKINKYNWSWDDSMLFGIILSTTDPILSVASVRNIGLSKIVVNLIKGESLFNDATTVIIFELYRDLAKQTHQELIKEIFIKLILKFFASTALGFFTSRLVSYWLQHIFNDGVVEIIVSFSMAYIIFFFAEWLGMSGVIAICILGLLLDTVSFSPGLDIFLYKFWSMLTFLAHIMIFLITGIVLAQKAFPFFNSRAIFYIITVYLSLNLTRGLVVFVLSPFLSRLGYGFNWRWGAVLIWSGMRGTFTLNMALGISQTESKTPNEFQIKTMLLLHSGTASLLTLMINSTTVKRLVTTLGLCNITLPKRMAMHNAVQRIRQMEANAFAMLKLDRFLADANWTMAEEAIKIDYPYKLDSEEVDQLIKSLRCPECNANVTFEGSSQQIADIMEEARLRLLTAQIASYQKQYNSGMLNQDAAQTLIGAAESYVDIEGKFMNIHEVKTYWESKGVLVKLKKLLSDWVYSVKEETFKAPKNKFLRMCHHMVFMDEFEYISTMMTFLNCVPIVLHFIPKYSSTFILELKVCNYYYLALYIMEALFKAFAMGRTYIFYHWNQFDLIIIVVGVVDVMIINLFKTLSTTYHMINTIRIFRFIRVLRILRLFKLVIPRTIYLLEKQINRQLTFRYDIAKGYVQGEEDTNCLIGQIAGHERVYQEIHRILEMNKQEAMKELGLMQRDYPEIVTGVKTKQAVQTVLNTASETLKFMISGGIVDKTEGAELHKMILIKKQQLATLPSTIAPPTAQELLRNVIWLQNDKKQVEYIQRKAKILYYDYGDMICEEGELPQGIHLIVSGMIKLSGSIPRYGVSKEAFKEIRARLPITSYTDYLVAGAIIGELNCLTKQEMEYSVTCETAVQTCFISIDDLLEAFDKFLEPPSLEYKIWLKLALDIALRTFKENLPNQDWNYKMCVQFSNIYLLDVPNHTKCDIFDGSMDEVILVHGTVLDCQLGQRYYAPFLLPKTCHQVQGTASSTKLLVVRSSEQGARKNPAASSSSTEGHYHSSRRPAALGHVFGMNLSSPSTINSDLEYTYLSSKNPKVKK
ncbi:sodium/hydrogen exchanger 10-like isoform X2 [Podarcis raffonei]|uniref:sodium/hydrogen exchanger 10-like isoform X2 n=1 Tax=Podarcis raffonei TaxID=65483 RepID=UPI0023297140|nr:sodium/hydrogen exchanger 10-like isoform X2 [Podarcis raffonei]